MSTKNIWVAAGDGNLDRVQATQSFIRFQAALNPATIALSPNAPDEFTYTPMHAAASYGHLHVLEYLISKGGDVNVQDGDGDTPLYTVENIETARFLVDNGATINHRNSEGVSPIEHLQEDFSDVASYLHSRLSPSSPPLATVQQPSQLEQDVASEELTSALMASVADIMERAEAEGRDPDEELRQLVGETVFQGVVAGYSMSETAQESEDRRPDIDDTPSKKPRVD
ncbi:hypothetical protein MKEN_00340800 [Mycena kentingensis (nom. inval.)]|nr:hypothetical protein MKEN_00340800 [Mycena kentingensis (nom. inval.)]